MLCDMFYRVDIYSGKIMKNQESSAEIIIVENESRNSRLISLQEILRNNFVIPVYQRPYAWSEANFRELLSTIEESNEQRLPAFFGSIIVAERSDSAHILAKNYFLIDGQQRITSFLLLLKLVREKLLEQEKLLDEAWQKQKTSGVLDESVENTILKKNNNKGIREKIDAILNDKKRIYREDTAKIKNKKLSAEADVLNYIFHDKRLTSSDLKKIPDIFRDWWDDVSSDDYVAQTKFILDRSQFCFLVVQGALSEDYAIDIFNTLNATGVPLTAFEILKSLAHKRATKKDASNNEATKLNSIEEDIKHMKKVKQTKYTDRLLLFVSMMHSELNRKQLNSFRDKRDFLNEIDKTHHKKIPEFIDTICDVHKFIINNWETSGNQRKIFKSAGEQEICFNFLQAMGHDRTLPILFKFKDGHSKNAIKACVAFTLLWRGVAADANTDRIDAQYKEIIEDLYRYDADIDKLKSKFRERLSGKWKNNKSGQRDFTKETWVEEFSGINLYKKIKLARFMLFVAFHKSIFDQETFQLENSKLKFLTSDNYHGDTYKTVEHVVPQSHKTINRPGNLILLPQNINSKAGNQKFIDKKRIYEDCLAKEQHEGDDLPYLRILREIASYDEKDTDQHGHLTEQAITTRGERLGNAIWETLANDWLDWSDR